MLTAGWDGLLGLFSTEIPGDDEVVEEGEEESGVPRRKRRKLDATTPQPKKKVWAAARLRAKITDQIPP